MLPRLKFGPRYGTPIGLSTLALSAHFAGCYSHAQYPGQVTVTDYGEGAVIEAELLDLRLEHGESLHWLELAVQQEDGRCSDVRVRLQDDARGRLELESLSFRSRSGRVEANRGAEWFVEHEAFRAAIYGDPVMVVLDGEAVTVHDEQVYNLRQFIEQVTCSVAQ